jgi:hypothetical protein
MKETIGINVKSGREIIRKKKLQKVKISSVHHVEHWRDGVMLTHRWQENICPNQYVHHVLAAVHSSATTFSTWYLLVFSSTATAYTPATGNTYATPGFTEATCYSGNRKVWQHAGVSSLEMTNSANKATFTITGGAPDNLYGSALVNYATPGDTGYASGILGPVAHFSEGAASSLASGDEVKVYITLTGEDV